jgi:predicted RNase H-like HicB family nuclease
MYKYEIIINWSQEDQLFIAEVPELLGCIAHGKTQEEAIFNIKEAMELWIGTAKEFGDFIPQPKSLQAA